MPAPSKLDAGAVQTGVIGERSKKRADRLISFVMARYYRHALVAVFVYFSFGVEKLTMSPKYRN